MNQSGPFLIALLGFAIISEFFSFLNNATPVVFRFEMLTQLVERWNVWWKGLNKPNV